MPQAANVLRGYGTGKEELLVNNAAGWGSG